MSLRKSWIFTAALPLSLHAHPGHEPFSEGMQHFVTSPSHFALPLLFSAGVIATASFLQRRRERYFVRGLGAIIAVVALLS